MTLKLTPRDKKLLYIMAYVVVIVGMLYFLIMPALDKKAELEETRLTAEQQLSMLQMQQRLLPDRIAQRDAALSELSTMWESYYPLMDNAALDDLITGLLTRFSLVPRSLVISQTMGGSLSPYTFASEYEGQATLSDENAYIAVAKVSGTTDGSQNNWMRLLDELAVRYPAIRIDSFSMHKVETRQEDNTVIETTEISFAFEIYCHVSLEGLA